MNFSVSTHSKAIARKIYYEFQWCICTKLRNKVFLKKSTWQSKVQTKISPSNNQSCVWKTNSQYLALLSFFRQRHHKVWKYCPVICDSFSIFKVFKMNASHFHYSSGRLVSFPQHQQEGNSCVFLNFGRDLLIKNNDPSPWFRRLVTK